MKMHQKYWCAIIFMAYLMWPKPAYANGMEGLGFLIITPPIVLFANLLKYLFFGPDKNTPLEPFVISIFLECIILYISFMLLDTYQKIFFDQPVYVRFLIYLTWSFLFSITSYLHNYLFIREWKISPDSIIKRILNTLFLGLLIPLTYFFTPLFGGIVLIWS